MSEKQGSKANANTLGRREFVRTGATAAVAATVASAAVTKAFPQAKGANERLGIGFIGVGGRAGAHLQIVDWMEDDGNKVEIAAVCDAYRPRMAAAADNYECKGYTDHRELLDDPRVDAVCIATPDHLHGYMALDAIAKGKHVYCEKPVTHWRQFELTKKLAAAAAKSKSVFQLGSQGMSDGAWHQIRDLIKEGKIGQPIHAECGYFRVGDWGERGMPIPDKDAKPGDDLNWEAFLGDLPKCPFDVSRYFRWRMYEDYAGGPSTDLYPHSLTPVIYMLGLGMPEKAVATGGKFRYQEREIPDTFNLLIDYPEKVTVCVLGTQGNRFATLECRGAGNRIPVLRGWEGSLTVRGKQIVFIPEEGEEKGKKKVELIEIKEGEDMFRHWSNFIDCCIKGDKNTFSPMDLALRVQTALQMGMLGLTQGKVAKFDAKKQEIVL